MEIQKKLKKYIAEALSISEEIVQLGFPSENHFGDFASSTALSEGKKTNGGPVGLANKIADYIKEKKDSDIEKVEVANPGFVNITLSGKYFANLLEKIIKEPNFGSNDYLKGKRVAIEYTDPNPFKEFHIGHLVPNTIGESLSRIFEISGAEVCRMNYQGDKGLHVAMAIYGMMHEGGGMENAKDLGRAYAYGAKALKENEDAKREITEINKKVYEESDEKIMSLYRKGKEISLQYFEEIYKTLGTKFDQYFFESETGPVGAGLVREFLEKGVFEESEGAIIYRGEKHGLHNRVFINSENLPTYEAKELGLAKVKYERFPYDLSFVVTANEIKEYFRVLLSAMSEVLPELAAKTHHIAHGILKLPTGKMSSRTGDVILAESLLDEVKEKIRSLEKEVQNEEVTEMVAIAAIKYSILKYAPGKDMIFDFDKSISFDGDSGPYLQYSAVRAGKIIEEASRAGINPRAGESSEIDLVTRLMNQFPEVVYRAGRESSPQHLITYLTELSSAFNTFYAEKRVLEGGEEAGNRLAIVVAFRKVIEEGLNLLGIKIPQRM